ncbi:hypothetical protein FFLO_00268 [Filobasidium floriforme]|uniref:Uncharacterized protein n=1 Tax=Filobasidium floriforme TaxID=5210 RepID=A0A8K0NR22_9TREE|nr:uncharacterized protein HD553DRAFT_336005 [Filobasidium floriforme]KAG7575449.1 hypothetical protein FFLO_00268 [Filobasidium floriforme]KAH8082586.1 hypothetical protein HD553DRAFT_336005 [Filobasidium floriforme]
MYDLDPTADLDTISDMYQPESDHVEIHNDGNQSFGQTDPLAPSLVGNQWDRYSFHQNLPDATINYPLDPCFYSPCLPGNDSLYLPCAIDYQNDPGHYHDVGLPSTTGDPSYIGLDSGNSFDLATNALHRGASYSQQNDGQLRTVTSFGQGLASKVTHAPLDLDTSAPKQKIVGWSDMDTRSKSRLCRWYEMLDIAIGSKDDLRIRQDMWNTVHQGKIDYVVYGSPQEEIPCRRCNSILIQPNGTGRGSWDTCVVVRSLLFSQSARAWVRQEDDLPLALPGGEGDGGIYQPMACGLGTPVSIILLCHKIPEAPILFNSIASMRDSDIDPRLLADYCPPSSFPDETTHRDNTSTSTGDLLDSSNILALHDYVQDKSIAPVWLVNDLSHDSHDRSQEAPEIFEDTELTVPSEAEPQISVAKSKMLRWDAMDERSEGRVEKLYRKKRIRKGSIDDQRLREDLLSAVAIEAAGWVEWKGEKVYFKRCITAKKSGGLCGAIVVMPGSQQNRKTTWIYLDRVDGTCSASDRWIIYNRNDSFLTANLNRFDWLRLTPPGAFARFVVEKVTSSAPQWVDTTSDLHSFTVSGIPCGTGARMNPSRSILITSSRKLRFSRQSSVSLFLIGFTTLGMRKEGKRLFTYIVKHTPIRSVCFVWWRAHCVTTGLKSPVAPSMRVYCSTFRCKPGSAQNDRRSSLGVLRCMVKPEDAAF